MKNILTILLTISFLFATSIAIADSGVIVETEGDVTIALPDKTQIKPETGAEIPEGATISAGSDGKAVILLVSGQMYSLLPKGRLIMTTDAPVKGNLSTVRGISLALHEMARGDRGEHIRAMVKARAEEFKLTEARKKKMEKDLKKLDELPVTSANGKKLLKAQVYYKYRQYEDALKLLLEVYRTQDPPSSMVKSMIAFIYEGLGKPEEAEKFRN